MAKAKEPTQPTETNPAVDPLTSMLGKFSAGTNAVPGAERLTELVQTTAKYGQLAMGQQVEAMNALAKARTAQDVVKIQADYSRVALESYLAHSGQVAQLMTDFVSTSSKVMTEQAESMIRRTQARTDVK